MGWGSAGGGDAGGIQGDQNGLEFGLELGAVFEKLSDCRGGGIGDGDAAVGRGQRATGGC